VSTKDRKLYILPIAIVDAESMEFKLDLAK
jgi:hypothetical protein